MCRRAPFAADVGHSAAAGGPEATDGDTCGWGRWEGEKGGEGGKKRGGKGKGGEGEGRGRKGQEGEGRGGEERWGVEGREGTRGRGKRMGVRQ